MPGVSGKYGSVVKFDGVSTSEAIVECTKWTMDRELEDHTYASCATGGKKVHVPGTEDITGTVEGVLDPTHGPDDPTKTGHLGIGTGIPLTLRLFMTTVDYHEIDVFFTKFSTEVDVESGDIVRWKADWVSNDAAPSLYNDV